MTPSVGACPDPGSICSPPSSGTGGAFTSRARRCYIEHGDGTACPNSARYQAHLTWTTGPMLLCEDHAADERANGDVMEIRTLPSK